VSGVFISYRREDAEGSAGRLYDRLVTRFDPKLVFMDLYSIKAAAEWKSTITETVSNCDVLLAVIGPRWSSVTDETGRRRLDSEDDYVRREIRTALESQVRVLPVLVQGALMVGSSELPADLERLAGLHAVELSTREFDRDVEQVHRFVEAAVEFGGELPGLEAGQTAVAGLVGLAKQGPTDEPVMLTKWNEFVYTFGGFHSGFLLPHCVHGWFKNGGGSCFVVRVPDQDGGMPSPPDFVGSRKAGLRALESIDSVTIVAVPDAVALVDQTVYGLEGKLEVDLALIVHCEGMGNRMAILDPPPRMHAQQLLDWRKWVAGFDSSHAALYYPWVRVMDPDGVRPVSIPPSGHVAGSWARSDQERGVWAAPANLPLQGVVDIAEHMRHDEWDQLRRAGINVIRAMPGTGIRAWGAETLSSDPARADIATVRLSSSVGSLVCDVTSWAAFERSGPRTWDRVKRSVEAVLETAWRQGAFVGDTAGEAFYVQCDGEVNVPELVVAGRIRVEFGFARRVPGEFVRMMVEQPTRRWEIYGD
jgi:hypothetical protein